MPKVQFHADKIQVITEKYSDHTAHVVIHVGEYQLDRIRDLVGRSLIDTEVQVTVDWKGDDGADRPTQAAEAR